MRKLLLFLFPLFLLSETQIIFSGHSAHFYPCQLYYEDGTKAEKAECNENNDAIGIQYEVLERLDVAAIRYLNSYNGYSNVFMLSPNIKRNKIKYKLNIGAVNGYGFTPNRYEPFLAPSIEIKHDHFVLDVGITPKIIFMTGRIAL